MLFRTHLAFAFLIALLVTDFLHIKNTILFIILAVVFSAFPDIDEKSSVMHKKLKPLSYIASLTGHRNIFHTIYFPILISLVLVLFNLTELSLAVVIGYISHLFLDAITKQGIAIFYPLSNKRIRGGIKVGSFMETIIFFILIILIIYLLIY